MCVNTYTQFEFDYWVSILPVKTIRLFMFRNSTENCYQWISQLTKYSFKYFIFYFSFMFCNFPFFVLCKRFHFLTRYQTTAHKVQKMVLICLKVIKLSAYTLKKLLNDSVMTGQSSLKWMCHWLFFCASEVYDG